MAYRTHAYGRWVVPWASARHQFWTPARGRVSNEGNNANSLQDNIGKVFNTRPLGSVVLTTKRYGNVGHACEASLV